MIVKLQHPLEAYPDLTFGQGYVVIGIEADDYRLLNDRGRPYLYPHELFEVVNNQRPSEWITEIGEEGEVYAYPPILNEAGFFEDFFDDVEGAVSAFWHVVNHWLTFSKGPGIKHDQRVGASIT